ncbi:MAG: hypothetical protein GY948_20215 [Alphaproteobacteria bacterium]|nr:hypothetical protein [Alphaproteobacteria bacterium]
MGEEVSQTIAPALEEVQRQFDAWRRAGRPGRRIPEELWNSATKLAREMGVNPVVEALHLDYMRLKRRVTGQVVSKPKALPAPKVPTFVELGVDTVFRSPECVVEFTGRNGPVRMQLAGPDPAALAALAEVLSRVEP